MKNSDKAQQNGDLSIKISPKQQVLALLDQCLATGVRGRVQAVIKQAIAEIQGQGKASGYQHAESDINEPDHPGLIFKVGRHKRRWVYRYTPKGARSTRQLTLGYFPQMDRDAAIKAWQAQRALMQDDEPQPEGISLLEGLARYREYARDHRRLWQREQRQLERMFNGALESRTAESLTLQEVEELVAPSAAGAKHRLSLLRLFFRVARGAEPGYGWMDPGRACPCEGLSLSRGSSSSFRANWPQLGAYHRAVLSLPEGEPMKPLLQLQLANLVSFRLLCRLHWDHLDLERGTARIELDGDSRHLVLGADLLAWLKRRRRESSLSGWVFSCPSDKSRPLPESYPVKLMRDLKRQLGLSDGFTTASVRQLAGDWFEEQGRATPTRQWPQWGTAPTNGQIEEDQQRFSMWVKRLHIQKAAS